MSKVTKEHVDKAVEVIDRVIDPADTVGKLGLLELVFSGKWNPLRIRGKERSKTIATDRGRARLLIQDESGQSTLTHEF